MNKLTETQRRRRGHQFFPTKAAHLPAIGTAGTVALADQVIRAHYFHGGCDWWLTEYDPTDGTAFGYVCLGDPRYAEWGSVSLAELEAYRGGPLGVVERDLPWTPAKVRDLALPGRSH